MNIFNIFKTKEEQFYQKIKNIASKQVNKKITISNLKVRVMTVQRTINSFSDKLKSLETEFTMLVENDDNVGLKYIFEQKEEIKLKLTVLFKIQNEFKQDFIKGVTLKIKELNDKGIPPDTFNYERIKDLVNTEIPTNYEKCVIFSDKISRTFWDSGRHITDEEIKQFK